MSGPDKRLRILNQEEIGALYVRPRFTQDEHHEYFALSVPEKEALGQFRSLKSKAFFILQLGYFKARRLFFDFELTDVKEDVAYIQEKYFSGTIPPHSEIAEGTRRKQQKLILGFCQHKNADAAIERKLEVRARQAAAVCGKPIYVFRELTHELARLRIVAPAYSTMQDIVGAALAYEQRRLAVIVSDHVVPSAKKALKSLLEDRQGLHEITLLKRDPRDFSNHEIRREVERGEQIRELYRLSQKVLPHLKISHENVKYYASLVDYYSVYKLRRMGEDIVEFDTLNWPTSML
jgi:Domain of unknown function (DUF4158)